LIDIALLPDLKILKIVDEVVEIAIAETRNLRYSCPDNVLCVIQSMINIGELANQTVSSIKVDGVEMLNASENLFGTFIFNFAEHGFFDASPFVGSSLVPMRSELLIRVQNTNAAANDFTTRLWAYVHQDDEREFVDTAVHSSIKATT